MKNILKENIMEILAISAVFQFLAVIAFIFLKDVKSTDTVTMMILTSSTNVLFIVLTFYFGSSKGSKDKQVKLEELNKTP